MADGNEMYDTIMRELNNLVFSNTDETKDLKQHESFSFQEEDIDDVPPSLLSYFETSKSRAAVCEKLILEEPEDFTAHLTEDMMSLPIEPDKDIIKLNEQVIRDTENEDNTSTDTRLLPTPSETEALFTHNVSVCPNNEGEAETGVYMESEKHSPFEVRTPEISLNEEERKKRADREKRHCEEIKHEEQKRQIERDFQKELKNIMEAEKLHQKELELMEKRAQDKLEQELLLQQELIRNLQRRVEEERRTMEEEQKRMKDEEDKKKKEEETIKMEAEKKRMKDERRKKEEEINIEEIKLKEEIRRMKMEEKRKREEEKNKTDLEKKKIEDDKRMMKEEEEGKRKEEEEKGKGTEERKQIEEVNKKRKMEEEINLKEEERKGREDVNMRTEEEGRKKMEKKKEVKEVRNGEEENRKIEEEEEQQQLEPIKEDEKKKKEDERKTKEEEQRRRQKEEIRRHRDEEDYRKSEEEIQDKQEYKGCDVDNREMEHESKTKDKEKKQQEERKDVHVQEPDGEEVGEKEDNKTEEEIRLHEKEESKKRVMQDTEREVTAVRAQELQEKREKTENNSIIGENEKNDVVKNEDSQASSPGSSHRESPVSPTSTETIPHQDRGKNISQASIDKTMDCENQAEGPFTASVFLPVCLPEHTAQKRLCWMKDCIPWSKLSLLNRRKQKGPARSRRGPRRAAEASSLPPLCPDSLLQSTGWKSLQEVTTVALEDLPGCSLSTLAQCTQLQALTLRRCGLKSLEGINQLQQLCYIDVQENDISFVDCEYMTSLRVLHLGHNKLTSIHGLTGAENLDVLNLSHNCITRIAGLESMRRLQRLSVDHNQLISTRGLRDVYTLLHLNCSHNHLASVEGLENSALLNTLDLRANSLTEPPSLNSQVLLRELHLDDNSISSLQSLTACWLPLMQHLSVAQNRITQLPFMSDSVSLAKLDLRFNCLSELQNLCESLEGCQSLREVHLTGNPLQQEKGWRSTLQKAVPGLRAIDVPETDSFLSPPAVQRVSLALGSFLTLCQAQLQQTHALQQRHGGELSNASSALDAVKTSCRHFTEALQLAKDQRFAHEYGDTTVADKHSPAGRTTPEETCNMDSTDAEKCPEISARRDTDNTATKTGSETRPTAGRANSNSVHFLTTKGKTTSSLPASNHQDLDLQSAAAVVIQQLWRKYRQKCRNISSTATAEKGGGGGRPESGPSYMNRHYAATVIQAFWRGFTLRRRLASALAAVTCPDTGEDDIFEEVDVDEFVFDEAALVKHWTLPLSEDSPPRRYPVSEQPLSLKPPQPLPEASQYILPPPLVWRSKQAWVAGEQVNSAGQAVSSNSSSSPASTSVLSGLSEKSEKILEEWGFTHSHTALLMLKRAQNMTSKKKQHKKRRDPSVRLTLFRNCSYQLAPVEARNRRAQRNRNDIKAREVEQGLQQAEKTERVKQEPAQQRLHTQAAHSDRDSQSLRFLPEISSDILNGGRVQLVADPGYTERLHHASGLWASSSLAVQPSRENNYLRRNSVDHERKEVPSPQRVTSAPSKKERISFRDNPVQRSLGWGGGKKRDKVYK